MNNVIISVGSNIDPEKHVFKARQILAKDQKLIDESKFIKTSPRGFLDQGEFLNGAFFISTNLDARHLKQYLKSIEHNLGRIRTSNKNGPRTIDLDIVVFNNQIVDQDYFQYDFVKFAVDEIRSRNRS